MTLKLGGNDVSKIYYKDKDVSGSQMLESGTIVYRGGLSTTIHLNSVDSHWTNISKLRIIGYGAINNYLDTRGNLYSKIDRTLIELKQSYTTTDHFKLTIVENESDGNKVLSVTGPRDFETIEVMVV